MTVLFVSRDLLFAPTLSDAAAREGLTFATVADPHDVVARAQHDPARLVIIDLGTPGLDVTELVASLKKLQPPPRVVAFGPHVHAKQMAAAREAGCDEVISRGSFSARASEILSLAPE